VSTILPPLAPRPKKEERKEKRETWEIPTTTLEEQIQQRFQQELEEDDAGLVEEDSNEFGLTRRDYEFLQWDIQNAIAQFEEEHGFDGIGYHEKDGSYVYSLDKVKELNERRSEKIKSKIPAQDIAVAKGLIKIKKVEAEG
jgi:hypothetical protein